MLWRLNKLALTEHGAIWIEDVKKHRWFTSLRMLGVNTGEVDVNRAGQALKKVGESSECLSNSGNGGGKAEHPIQKF